MTTIEVPCPTCAATGNMTPGGGRNNLKDRCTTCGGRRTIPARPGESREASWPFAVPGAELSAKVAILEERVKAGVRYFRDGAAVRTGVLPDHASHIADVLQSLLSEPVPPRAAEPADDALAQARRLAADLAEERFRGDLAALFMSGAGDDHPWVQVALRGLEAAQGASYQDRVYRHFQYVAGDDPTDLTERRDRANEDFAELVQALGGTLEGWIAIGRYVWGRPVGEPEQEMGGTLNTLAALASWAHLNMMACAEAELARTMQPDIVAKIRHKRANRHGRGVLPGDDADLVTSAAEAGL